MLNGSNKKQIITNLLLNGLNICLTFSEKHTVAHAKRFMISKKQISKLFVTIVIVFVVVDVFFY